MQPLHPPMGNIQTMLMNHMKLTLEECHLYLQVHPEGTTIPKCHPMSMGPYRGLIGPMEATQELHRLATASPGRSMAMAMEVLHPHPQDMVPMTDGVTIIEGHLRTSHQTITSCLPRESIVETLSEFMLITTKILFLTLWDNFFNF